MSFEAQRQRYLRAFRPSAVAGAAPYSKRWGARAPSGDVDPLGRTMTQPARRGGAPVYHNSKALYGQPELLAEELYALNQRTQSEMMYAGGPHGALPAALPPLRFPRMERPGRAVPPLPDAAGGLLLTKRARQAYFWDHQPARNPAARKDAPAPAPAAAAAAVLTECCSEAERRRWLVPE